MESDWRFLPLRIAGTLRKPIFTAIMSLKVPGSDGGCLAWRLSWNDPREGSQLLTADGGLHSSHPSSQYNRTWWLGNDAAVAIMTT